MKFHATMNSNNAANSAVVLTAVSSVAENSSIAVVMTAVAAVRNATFFAVIKGVTVFAPDFAAVIATVEPHAIMRFFNTGTAVELTTPGAIAELTKTTVITTLLPALPAEILIAGNTLDAAATIKALNLRTLDTVSVILELARPHVAATALVLA